MKFEIYHTLGMVAVTDGLIIMSREEDYDRVRDDHETMISVDSDAVLINTVSSM